MVAFKEHNAGSKIATRIFTGDAAMCDSTAAMAHAQIAAALLEAGGPLKIIGAQLVFIGQPLFSGLLSSERLDLLAGILEEPEKTSRFVQYLREEAQE